MVAKRLEDAKEMTSHISDLITKREEQKKARRRSKAPSELSEEEARIKLYLGIGTQALHATVPELEVRSSPDTGS